MSYILDALKKSDQERQQGNSPTLQTIHKPHFSRQDSPQWRVVALMVASLLVGVVGLASWYLLVYAVNTDRDIDASPTHSSVQQQAPSDTPEHASVAAIAKPLGDVSTLLVTAEPGPKTAVIEPAVLATVVELWELPDPVQQAIPSLTFSFHVYSSNADRRTIIINKRRVKEGAVISAGLTLVEITEQGVILDWKNRHRFMINVVEGW